MKIAIVNQPESKMSPRVQSGSIPIWIYNVAQRLKKRHEVVIYSGESQRRQTSESHDGLLFRYLPIGPDQRLLRLIRRLRGGRAHKLPLFAAASYYVLYSLQVAIDIKRQGCDVVHLHNFSQFVPVIRALNPRVHIVLHMHCEWLSQLDRQVIEKRLAQVDAVITCSNYVTDKVKERFPEIAPRCFAVHNGVLIDHFSPDQRGEQNGLKRVLFVGRVSPEKGIHVLLDAFQKISSGRPNVHLEIVGSKVALPKEYLINLSDNQRVVDLASYYKDGSRHSYFNSLQDAVRRSNMDDSVRFFDPVPHLELREYYGHADVFVFPSVWDEPFGMPPIEAMAAGVPVVATRTGGITETVKDGVTGFLVDPADAEGLAAALEKILDDDELRTSMGRAARSEATDHFTYDHIVERLLVIYSNISETA